MKREDVKTKISGITDEQLDWLMAENGSDINRERAKVTTITAERDGLQTQLTAANGKLEGYDPEWKAKAEQAKTNADAQVAAVKSGYAADQAVSGLKFSSESAKRAFVADLKAKNLPLQEDKLLGFDDFVSGYRKTDPNAFMPDNLPPKFAAAAPGVPAQPTGKDAANAAFRAAFGKE